MCRKWLFIVRQFYEFVSKHERLHACSSYTISGFYDSVSLPVPNNKGSLAQTTVGGVAEINSGSHRSGAKLNFPFPESTLARLSRRRTTPPRRERAQAHLSTHAHARTRTQALTMKLLLSGSRCVHSLPISAQSSLGTVQRHARVECRFEVTISFLIPFQVRLFSPASSGRDRRLRPRSASETLHVERNLGQRRARA